MSEKAKFPITGTAPTSHAAAKTMTTGAIDSLKGKEAGKHRGEATPPGQDTSALNAAKARREGWKDGGLPTQHTSRQ